LLKKYLEFDNFFILGLSILIPTAISLSANLFLSPVLNSFMGRTENPELSISVYAISMSILFFIGLPHLRIQQLTIVYYKNFNKITIHYFVFLVGLLCTILSVLIFFTPLNIYLLKLIFGLSGELLSQVNHSLKLSFFIPFILVLKMHFYGIAIVSKESKNIWRGTIFSFLVTILIAIFIFFMRYDGYLIGVLSFSIATLLETFFIAYLVRKQLWDYKRKIFQKDLNMRVLLNFFYPLLFAAFLPGITFPLVNATLSRFENPELSIASVSVGFGIFGTLGFAINGCQSTILSLLTNGYNYIKIRNFSYIIGFITLFICLIAAWIDPISSLIFEKILGLDEQLASNSLLVFRILSFLPPFLVMEQLYVGLIMDSKLTTSIIYINICRLGVLIICLYTGILLYKSSGAMVGGLAWGLTLFFESWFAWFFARNLRKSI